MRARLSMNVFSLHLRTLMQYRVDFWVNWLLGLAATMAAAYFLWRAVFEHEGITELAGYSFRGLMFYYVLALLVDKAVLGSGRGMISQDIYEGTLNRYLVYPINLFGYKLAEHWASGVFAVGQGALAWIAFAWIFGMPAEAPFNPSSLVLGLAALAGASMLFLVMTFCVEMVAFWADNVWSLSVLMMFLIRLLGGTMIPLAMFPQAAQDILQWLPFASIASFPIRTLMGQLDAAQVGRGLLVIAAWMAVFGVSARLIFAQGMRRYSGLGI